MGIFERLWRFTASQYGYFTVSQASEVGVRDAHVRRLAQQGKVERRAQGVYRITAAQFDERAEFMEAVLWAGGKGLISGPSALVLRDLADLNPRQIHLVVPPPYNPRGAHAEQYVITRTMVSDQDIDEIEGIPTVATAIAIQQSIDANIPGDLIEQAISRALARELIGMTTGARLRVRLYDRNVTGAPA